MWKAAFQRRWALEPVPRTSIPSRSGSQPATPARPTMPLVEHVEAGDLADLLARPRERRQRLVEQLLAVDVDLPPGGVERAGEQAAGAGRLDQADAAVDDRVVDPAAAAEVEHRRLGEAADDLVGRGGDEVGAGLERRRSAGRGGSGGARPRPRRRPAAPRASARPRPARRRRRRRRSRWGRRPSPPPPPGFRPAPPPASRASARGRSPARGRARGRRRSAACR